VSPEICQRPKIRDNARSRRSCLPQRSTHRRRVYSRGAVFISVLTPQVRQTQMPDAPRVRDAAPPMPVLFSAQHRRLMRGRRLMDASPARARTPQRPRCRPRRRHARQNALETTRPRSAVRHKRHAATRHTQMIAASETIASMPLPPAPQRRPPCPPQPRSQYADSIKICGSGVASSVQRTQCPPTPGVRRHAAEA